MARQKIFHSLQTRILREVYIKTGIYRIQWIGAVASRVISGLWSPHMGKPGGIGGRSACVPTWKIKFIPITIWYKK